ncbi:hypothetical protein GCM10009558_003350 [Virgisporangium aurantiacum]
MARSTAGGVFSGVSSAAGAGSTGAGSTAAVVGWWTVAETSADAASVSVRMRPASSTRQTDATTTRPSTDTGIRYGAAPVSPYRAATPAMCQYETHAAMLAIDAVAASRTAASDRRCTGTREISSTVSSRASGGHAAMA